MNNTNNKFIINSVMPISAEYGPLTPPTLVGMEEIKREFLLDKRKDKIKKILSKK